MKTAWVEGKMFTQAASFRFDADPMSRASRIPANTTFSCERGQKRCHAVRGTSRQIDRVQLLAFGILERERAGRRFALPINLFMPKRFLF